MWTCRKQPLEIVLHFPPLSKRTKGNCQSAVRSLTIPMLSTIADRLHHKNIAEAGSSRTAHCGHSLRPRNLGSCELTDCGLSVIWTILNQCLLSPGCCGKKTHHGRKLDFSRERDGRGFFSGSEHAVDVENGFCSAPPQVSSEQSLIGRERV